MARTKTVYQRRPRAKHLKAADRRPGTVRAWLQANARTQTWLARELGISDPFLAQVLNGDRNPSLALAFQIEFITGVPARSFARLFARP